MDKITKEITDSLAILNNKVDAMNKYYARTVTVVNAQLDAIKDTHATLLAIHDAVVKVKDDSIELTATKTKKKAVKSS